MGWFKSARKQVKRSTRQVSKQVSRSASQVEAEAKRAKEKAQAEVERVAKQAAEEAERVAKQVREEAKRGLRALAGAAAVPAASANSAISLGSDVGASPGTIGATREEIDKKSNKLVRKKKRGTTGTKIKRTPLKEAGGIQI